MKTKVMGIVELSNRLGIGYATMLTILCRPEFNKFDKSKTARKRLYTVNDDFKETLLTILKIKANSMGGNMHVKENCREVIKDNLSCLE